MHSLWKTDLWNWGNPNMYLSRQDKHFLAFLYFTTQRSLGFMVFFRY